MDSCLKLRRVKSDIPNLLRFYLNHVAPEDRSDALIRCSYYVLKPGGKAQTCQLNAIFLVTVFNLTLSNHRLATNDPQHERGESRLTFSPVLHSIHFT